MTEKEFERFQHEYLTFFKNRYKRYRNTRKELKRTVFENPSLSEKQKEMFWNLVTEK